ncbi:MAG TPA: hypothetical protein VH583_25925 [Vicinamibacterales bacterium]
MIISVINLSNGAVPDADLQRAIRAINRQISGDFAPYWGFGSQLRLEGKSGKAKGRGIDPADMRGDAILYLRDVVRMGDVEGYHDRHFTGIPFGVVFLELSKKLEEDWSVTLSHEALELTGDSENNLLVQGPHPKKRRHSVFHWFEMCDAVQNETYEIDQVTVSNFVLPLYFTSSNERGGRNDFLGTVNKGKTLSSFSVNPGGYIGFFDPAVNDDVTWSLDDDAKGKQRLNTKQVLRSGRGQRRRANTRALR